MKYLYKIVLFFFSLLLFYPWSSSKAQGSLVVVPKRVVFEGTKRVQEINLGNSGADTTRFTISLVHYRMEKDGGFTLITTPDSGQYFVDKYVRFFPRSVKLAPGEAQTIKVQVVNSTDAKPGEYRSHLFFIAEPKVEKQITDKPDTTKARDISIKLIPKIGLTIPLIYRNGVSNTVVSISNAAVRSENGKHVLQMDINRTGNMSVYGDIKVNYIADGGAESTIGEVKGLAVYSPTPVRTVSIALEPKTTQSLRKGKLHITYISQPDSKQITRFADTELLLK